MKTILLNVTILCVLVLVRCKQENPQPYTPAAVTGTWLLKTPAGNKYLSFKGGTYKLESATDVYAPGKKSLVESGTYFTVVDSLHLSGARYLYDVNRNVLDSLAIRYRFKYAVSGDTMQITPEMEGQGRLLRTASK